MRHSRGIKAGRDGAGRRPSRCRTRWQALRSSALGLHDLHHPRRSTTSGHSVFKSKDPSARPPTSTSSNNVTTRSAWPRRVSPRHRHARCRVRPYRRLWRPGCRRRHSRLRNIDAGPRHPRLQRWRPQPCSVVWGVKLNLGAPSDGLGAPSAGPVDRRRRGAIRRRSRGLAALDRRLEI